MAKFQKGQSGNPSGRPKSAANLRALLQTRYGDDGHVLVDRLEALSKGRGKLALDATELLLAYHAGKPVNMVDVGGTAMPAVLILDADPGAQ